MINIATVHHHDPAWINIQISQFEKHLSMPYKVWASLEGIPTDCEDMFDVVIPSVGKHEGKLNLLAAEIAETQGDDDLILFIDGDAFPVGNLEPICRLAREYYDLIAVQRLENLGDIQPHPLFTLMSIGTWKLLDGDWSGGYPWINQAGERVSDVGGNLLRSIERTSATWHPIRRSNQRNLHPLWFGIYGGIVYHHGAGFRFPVSRVDVERSRLYSGGSDGTKVQNILNRFAKKLIAHRGARLSEKVFTLLETDLDSTIDFLNGESYMLKEPEFVTALDDALKASRKLQWCSVSPRSHPS